MLKTLSRRVVAVSVLASAIGGLVTGLVFQTEIHPDFLNPWSCPERSLFLSSLADMLEVRNGLWL
jgi:hypothetical protein